MKNDPLAAEVPGRGTPGTNIVPSGPPGAFLGPRRYMLQEAYLDRSEIFKLNFVNIGPGVKKVIFPRRKKFPGSTGGPGLFFLFLPIINNKN